MATTFLRAPASSHPTTSVLRYTRNQSVESHSCSSAPPAERIRQLFRALHEKMVHLFFDEKRMHDMVRAAKKARVPMHVPFHQLSAAHQRWVLEGDERDVVDLVHDVLAWVAGDCRLELARQVGKLRVTDVFVFDLLDDVGWVNQLVGGNAGNW